MAVLDVEGVTKRFGSVLAVDHVSFSARRGRIFGLLGPNGAGKTTTIRMITYMLVPDGGRIMFAGESVGPVSQARMGYLPEERGLYRKMKAGEQLQYLAMLKGMDRAAAARAVSYWLERFEAGSWHKKRVDELSKGMQQKIQFIATIVHDPDLLILDEPFSGLDPINAEVLKEVILELKGKGRTMLFASHRMEQVEQLCDDICLISRGRSVLQGSLRDIKQSFGRDTVLLEFEGGGEFLDALVRERRVRINSRSGHRAELRLLENTSPRLVLDRALEEVDTLYRFELVEPSLNEIFIATVSRREVVDEPADGIKPFAVDTLDGEPPAPI